nr:DNA glycosylase [Luxibacter massiliensis]
MGAKTVLPSCGVTERAVPDFSLAQICDSGQCFRMAQKDSSTYTVTAGDRYLEITQEGVKCTFHCPEDEFDCFWKHYFDLDRDYKEYKERISSRDTYLSQAAQFGEGIRILNQDLWEMTVSFLISQQNHIARIRRCIQNISEKYGEEKQAPDGTVYYAFPSAEVLAGLSEDGLKDCNLGYRSKYVVRTARSVANGDVLLGDIQKMPYREAREELLKLFGVGEKVADCICLFALHHLEAFPVDTHISQALKAHYPKGFPSRRYKGMQGVMQQYIFYYELKGKKEVQIPQG